MGVFGRIRKQFLRLTCLTLIGSASQAIALLYPLAGLAQQPLPKIVSRSLKHYTFICDLQGGHVILLGRGSSFPSKQIKDPPGFLTKLRARRARIRKLLMQGAHDFDPAFLRKARRIIRAAIVQLEPLLASCAPPIPAPPDDTEPDPPPPLTPTASAPTNTPTPVASPNDTEAPPTPTAHESPSPSPTAGFPQGINIALGKPCTFEDIPNYSLTSDINDSSNLTDGIRSSSSSVWTDPLAVGWVYPPKPLLLCALDLLSDYAIDTIVVSSGGGGTNGVFAPATIEVYGSLDGTEWSHIANLATQYVDQSAKFHVDFEKSNLAARARYLRFYAMRSAHLLFADEIEVLTGPDIPFMGGTNDTSTDTSHVSDDAYSRFPLGLQQTTSLGLLAQAESALGDGQESMSEEVTATFSILRESILDKESSELVERSSGLPFTSDDRAILEAFGQELQLRGLPPFEVWVPPADSNWKVSPFARASSAQGLVLWAHMMGNETESVSFLISNNTATDQVFSLTLPENTNSAPQLKLHQALYVAAPGYQLIADALAPLNSDTVTVPPGMTTEIWASISSQGLAAGTYTSSITVTPVLGAPNIIPLTVYVYSPQMPSVLQYHTTLFSYLSDPHAQDFPQATADILSQHYSNAQTLNWFEIPQSILDADGSAPSLGVHDFTQLDASIALMPDAQKYILIVGLVGRPLGTLLEQGSPAHQDTFKQWVLLLAAHLDSLGLERDRWALYFVDEPTVDEIDTYLEPAFEWTKEADSNIRIIQNWNSAEAESRILSLANGNPSTLIDIALPSESRLVASADTILSAFPKGSVWKYDSMSSLAMDPYATYRLSHWKAWNWGLAGAGKWNFLSSTEEASPWSDYGCLQSWAMVYPGLDGPITSKRYEAWRDGIEDYELLRILAEEAEESGDPLLISLLEGGVATVLASDNSGNPDILKAYRLAILQSLP